MKEHALKIAVVVALIGVAFALRGRDRPPENGETPEPAESSERSDWTGQSAAVTQFFEAASAGDDEAYLRLAGGDLRKSLEQTRSELGLEAFRESLRRSAQGIKGLATMPGESAPPGLAAVEVEIVFADRNERQKMLLAPNDGAWVITSIEQALMVKPPVPYGTPVFEEPLEQEEPQPQP